MEGASRGARARRAWLALALGALALGGVFALRRGPERSRGAAPPVAAAEERAVSSGAPAAELARAAVPEPVEAAGNAAPGLREAVTAAGTLVAGRVEVEGGIPAGERVVVRAQSHRAGVSRRHSRDFEAPVALDGSFELRVPEDTHSVELELDALLLFLEDEVEVRPGTSDVVLRPKALAAVRGRVHRPLGLDSRASGEGTIHVAAGKSSVYAEPDGRFELVVAPGEPLELVASTAESEGLEARFEVPALRACEIRWVEAFLEPMPWLRGVVTDEGGAPLEGAAVLLVFPFVPRMEPIDPPLTGTDGRFVLGPLRPGPCEIQARAPGRRSERRELVLPGDARDTLHISLAPAEIVRGLVVGPDGAAFAGAVVHGLNAPSRRIAFLRGIHEREPPLRTDREGRFTYTVDDPPIRLVASAEGFADSVPLAVEQGTASTESEVVLTLRPACSLRVRVLDDEDRPVETVVSFRSEDGRQHVLLADEGLVEAHDLPPGRAWIDAGWFEPEAGRTVTTAYEGGVEVVLSPELETEALVRVRRTE